MKKEEQIQICPVHHFYGPMKGAEFNIPSLDIALEILKDKRIMNMERKLYEMTCQAWRFKIVNSPKGSKGARVLTKEDFFDPKGKNSQLL
jgi:hypothetical protein